MDDTVGLVIVKFASSLVIPAKAGIHDTVGLVIVKFRSSLVIPAKAGIHLVSLH